MKFEQARPQNRRRMTAEIRRLIGENERPEDLAEAMVAALTTSHRALQQTFLGAVKLTLYRYGNLDPALHTDRRNQSAYKWAREVAGLPDGDLPFPFLWSAIVPPSASKTEV
jgi:hypothetical protein